MMHSYNHAFTEGGGEVGATVSFYESGTITCLKLEQGPHYHACAARRLMRCSHATR